MKAAIAELRSTIGRLRPHLIHDHHPSSVATTTQQQSQSSGVTDAGTADATTNDNDNPNEESSVINELQLEAATELVNAISSFVWNLDCLWEETSSLAEKEGCDDNNMQAVNIAVEPNAKAARTAPEGEVNTPEARPRTAMPPSPAQPPATLHPNGAMPVSPVQPGQAPTTTHSTRATQPF